MSHTVQEIWYALEDPAARLRMEQVATDLGYVPRGVAPGGGAPPPQCGAVVSDLLPPGPALSWFDAIREERQGIPIVLYLPVRTGVDAALSRAMGLGVDAVIFQRGRADERERLRGELAVALEQRMVANLLDGLAAEVPRSKMGFRVLKHFGIKLSKAIDATDHVETVARALDTSPRTLQRMLGNDGWPGAKELLDWMLLFQVALAGVLPEGRALRRRIRRAVERLLRQDASERAPTLEAVRAAFIARFGD